MANMFRCTLASGGGALILTVTCDADFAGLTITATDGTTTLTQPCPSSSPYEVEFKIPNAGQWTISGVISGETQSLTIDIPDNVTLHYIPNGSTVTPTDDIQIWLHCAGIWDKAYTTISQILADGDTVTALIMSDNAVDYMVRSTTWASSVCADSSAMTKIGANDYCANTLLLDSTWVDAICNSSYYENVLTSKSPIMTAASTPANYVASANSQRTSEGFYAWKAFNTYSATPNTGWATDIAGTNVENWIQLKFANPISVNLVKMAPRSASMLFNFPSSWRLEGSNDGTNFTPISDTIVETQPTSQAFKNTPIPNNTKYSYIRVHTYGCFADRTAIGVLTFLGRS